MLREESICMVQKKTRRSNVAVHCIRLCDCTDSRDA